MGSKRCAVCNKLNEEERIYCKFCQAFLGADTGRKSEPKKSIWEIQGGSAGAGVFGRPEDDRKKKAEEKGILICPVCGLRYPVSGENRPLLCSGCSYFFTDQDKPVRPDAPGKKEQKEKRDEASQKRTHGPMRRAGQDKSLLRLIGLTENAPFVLNVSEEGSILGSAGNLRPELFQSGKFHKIAPQHLALWHTPAGWYLRALKGVTLYNGEEMNLGVSRRLSDGDFLNAGDCSIRVEITGREGND